MIGVKGHSLLPQSSRLKFDLLNDDVARRIIDRSLGHANIHPAKAVFRAKLHHQLIFTSAIDGQNPRLDEPE